MPRPPLPARATAAQRRRAEREAAKAAMVAALGVVTLTGFALMGHHRRSKSTIVSTHVVTGLALVGASYWHYTLYGRPLPRAAVAARPRRDMQIK